MTREELSQHRQTHDKSNSWWMFDARGIELCRVCGECEESARATYSPAILGTEPGYEEMVEEPIEPDE
jgi:hypothetical protein